MQILCGQCGRTMDVEDAKGGSTMLCAHCGRDILVPSLEGDAGPRAAETVPEEDFAAHARQAIQQKIHVTCKNCGRKLSIGRRLAGQTGKCPKCGGEIVVPSLDDDEEVERIIHRTAAVAREWDFADIEVVEFQESGEAAPPHPYVHVPYKHHPPGTTPAPEGATSAAGEGAPGTAAASPLLPQQPPKAAGPVITLAPPAELETLSAAVRRETPRAKPAKKRSKSVVGLLLILLIVGGVCGWKYLKPAETQPASPEEDAVPPPSAAKHTGTGKKPVPGGSAHKPPTPPPPNPLIPESHGKQAKGRVLETQFSIFAAGNYLPARPGFVYCRLTAEIIATDKPVSFNADSEDVGLVDGQQRFACLGVPVEKSLIPRAGVPKPITIPAGAKQNVTLVFRVPAGASAATLVIRGVDPMAASIANASPIVAKNNAVGTFDESPPRSLKPLLRDPLMAALQDTGFQRLVITHDANGFDLVFPTAGVTGKATFTGEGMFSAELRYAGSVLPCKLRLADPNVLILYLKDTPFHQMVFARASGAGVSPAPVE